MHPAISVLVVSHDFLFKVQLSARDSIVSHPGIVQG